jgi:hypothetical protein
MGPAGFLVLAAAWAQHAAPFPSCEPPRVARASCPACSSPALVQASSMTRATCLTLSEQASVISVTCLKHMQACSHGLVECASWPVTLPLLGPTQQRIPASWQACGGHHYNKPWHSRGGEDIVTKSCSVDAECCMLRGLDVPRGACSCGACLFCQLAMVLCPACQGVGGGGDQRHASRCKGHMLTSP